MTKAEVKQALIEALEIDVSWHKCTILKWYDERPNLGEVGVDDLGDCGDYLEGIRWKIQKVIRAL